MNDVDARLAAALGAEPPPERDPLFRLAVIARIERARFRQWVLWTTGMAVVAIVLVAMNARAIDAWMAADARHVWIAGGAALAALLALPGAPIAATPGVRSLVTALRRWFAG
jgi:hypothetical protein